MSYNRNDNRPDSGIILFYIAGFLLILAIVLAIWGPKVDDKAPEVVKEKVVELPPVDKIKVTEPTPERPDTSAFTREMDEIENCDTDYDGEGKLTNGGEEIDNLSYWHEGMF